jgi:predicted Holliday junction resolvase-like endonuclease
LGDFGFGEVVYLEPMEAVIYWLVWIMVCVITCIVFLNFIIAEVSTSYAKVKERLDSLFLSERAKLIQEAQDMLFKSMKKNENWFPKYLITRELEE